MSPSSMSVDTVINVLTAYENTDCCCAGEGAGEKEQVKQISREPNAIWSNGVHCIICQSEPNNGHNRFVHSQCNPIGHKALSHAKRIRILGLLIVHPAG